MKPLIIIAAMLFSFDAIAGERTKWMPITSTALLAMDWHQSHAIAKSDKHLENNPILGRNPDTFDVDAYFMFVIAGNLFLRHAMPPEYYSWLQAGIIGMELKTIRDNWMLGFRLGF